MNLLYKSVALALCCGAFASCVQDEAPNAECDILKATLRVAQPSDFFFSQADSIQSVSTVDSVIRFDVRSEADLSALAPEFLTTPGATIEPASGSVHDFSQGAIEYRVTSEDGAWSRRYEVEMVRPQVSETSVFKYSFEDYILEPSSNKYYVWLQDGSTAFWDSGNGGFKLSKPSATKDNYPSVVDTNGLEGSCVKLTTQSTGALGTMAGMRLAAGNLFVGSFDVAQALKNAMLATCFGRPFTSRPTTLKGYYKYTPGAQMQNRSGAILPDSVDSPDIYAVLYRNTDENGNNIVLHGDDVLTSDYLVAKARINNAVATEEWTEFELPFVYIKDVDEDILKNRGYSLVIVFSSSINGASFVGAIGSTLMIDEVTLICKEYE